MRLAYPPDLLICQLVVTSSSTLRSALKRTDSSSGRRIPLGRAEPTRHRERSRERSSERGDREPSSVPATVRLAELDS